MFRAEAQAQGGARGVFQVLNGIIWRTGHDVSGGKHGISRFVSWSLSGSPDTLTSRKEVEIIGSDQNRTISENSSQ